uniref:Cytochrome c oxidase subunit 3 n=1 Tax=Petrobiona massiliana TaxID=68578 RepID=A0A140CUU0_9METZ|nr:cytochrome c oxidase subunit 3 [Petrobiona massiliana]
MGGYYFLPGPSWLPMMGAFGVFGLISTLWMEFRWGGLSTIAVKMLWFVGMVVAILSWSRVILVENVLLMCGKANRRILVLGFLLFLVGESGLFLSLFISLFYAAIQPMADLGSLWPPGGCDSLNPILTPFTNTLLLLGSGAAVTWGHKMYMGIRYSRLAFSMAALIGMLFLLGQAWEYYWSTFSFRSGTYGSTFFLATGCHGCHVTGGALFLVVASLNVSEKYFEAWPPITGHPLRLEAMIWYWHLVDALWLGLWMLFYHWMDFH